MNIPMTPHHRAALLASATAAGLLTAPTLARAQAPGEVADVGEIVVTGSHLPRPATDATLPIGVIDATTIRQSGQVILGDVLDNAPMITANANSQNTSGTLFSAGQARVDLRGLGANRTLVLMDGRRHVNGDAANPAVDLNTIPSLMVDRVEIYANGASAAYGSEAIAGVVNLVMKNRFEGLKLDAQGGVSSQGDGEDFIVGALWGRRFADERLSVVVGAELARQEPILRTDREDEGLFPGIRRDSAATPQTIIPQSRTNLSPTAVFQFNRGGLGGVAVDVRDPTRLAALTGSCAPANQGPTCQDAALDYAGRYDALQNRTERAAVRGHLEYRLTDQVEVFAEASYAQVKGYGLFAPAFSSPAGGGLMPVALRGDNGFLVASASPAAQQLRTFWGQAFGAAGFTQANTVNVGKSWVEFGGRNAESQREVTRLLGGARGEIAWLDRTFRWDGYAQYGRLDGDTAHFGVPNIQRVQQAVDAVLVGGQVVCRNPAARAAGCVPWDLINGPSREAVLWANAVSSTRSRSEQTVVAGNLSFDLVTLPAGPLALAAGLEYRKEESRFAQDPLAASGALFINAIRTRSGEFDVKEAYGEVRVPILKDLPLAHELTLEGALRGSDYSSVGHTHQYRLAALWAPVPDIQIHASQATAVRAPDIVELYAPQSRSFTNLAGDPCDKDVFRVATAAQQAARRLTCAAAITGWNPATFTSNIGPGRAPLALVLGGNPDLGAERAKTYGLGAVIQPRWIPRLKITLDFFKYDIRDGVGSIPLQILAQNLCYDAAVPLPSNPFCALIRRDPTGTNGGAVPGGVLDVTLTQQNVSRIKIEGFDGSVAYGFDLDRVAAADLGRLDLRVDVTDMYRWAVQGLPGQAYGQLADTVTNAALPRWKAVGSATWTRERLSVTWTTRFIGSVASTVAFAPSALSPYYTGDYYRHDLRAVYRLNDRIELRGGVLNITDKYPPSLPETFLGATQGTSIYDNRGRYGFIGATFDF